MDSFIPDIAYIDPRCEKYETAKTTIEYLKEHKVPTIYSRKVEIDGKTPIENYAKSKRTIYVTINGEKRLKSCRPSADYQFSLSSSCPGSCEYCYLQTTQGEKPFIKLFVNIDDILNVLKEHIISNLPHVTTFECGSITDPVATEHLSGNLRKCIDFFGTMPNGRLRIITKYSNVDSFLGLNHNEHTKFRFSINAPYVINKFEHNTSSFKDRIVAAKKISDSGYPIGFIIAPIMIFNGWMDEYKELLEILGWEFRDYSEQITFELIQHRFTATAKELILSRFPKTDLDMDEEKRKMKWGPYGKFKYVYPESESSEIKEYISELISANFEDSLIEYFT